MTLLLLLLTLLTSPSVPRCEEDAVLVGVGDFEAGRWSAYECGYPAQDYIVDASDLGRGAWRALSE